LGDTTLEIQPLNLGDTTFGYNHSLEMQSILGRYNQGIQYIFRRYNHGDTIHPYKYTQTMGYNHSLEIQFILGSYNLGETIHPLEIYPWRYNPTLNIFARYNPGDIILP